MKSWIDYTFWKYQADQWIIEVLSTNTSKTGKSRHVSLLSLSEQPKNFLIYPNQHRKRKQNYLHSLGIFPGSCKLDLLLFLAFSIRF